jgi:hypothetical protein
MAVALDDLRSYRRGRQSSRAQMRSWPGPIWAKVPTAPEILPPAALGGGAQAFHVAAGLLVPDGELQPEGDRLKHARRGCADLDRIAELQPFEDRAQGNEAGQQDGRSLLHCSACAVSTTRSRSTRMGQRGFGAAAAAMVSAQVVKAITSCFTSSSICGGRIAAGVAPQQPRSGRNFAQLSQGFRKRQLTSSHCANLFALARCGPFRRVYRHNHFRT